MDTHQLRTLLNGIKGSAMAAQVGLSIVLDDDDLPDGAREELREVEADVETLAEKADELEQEMLGDE